MKIKNEQEIFKTNNELSVSLEELEKFKLYQETLKGEYGMLASQKTSLQEEILILANSNKNLERQLLNLEIKIKALTQENFTKSQNELLLI